MMQRMQAREFCGKLTAEEKIELCKAIAEDIFFFEEELQESILAILHETEPELAEEIRQINGFTI